MPEYDAFGREIGDDPLAALREAASPTPPIPEPAPAEPAPTETVSPRADTVSPRADTVSPRAETVAEERAAASGAGADALAAWSGPAAPPRDVGPPEARPARVAPTRRIIVRRRRGGLAGLILVAAVLAAAGLVANSAVETGRDIIRGIEPPLAEPAPTGLEARSLIRAENFRRALDALAGAGLGRPTSIRVAPERVDATLIANGKAHNVQVTADGRLRDFGSGPGIGTPLGFNAIDPTAPERIVRRGANRRHPPRTINYVLISPGPPLTVGAYFNGRIVIGDRHGRPQRVIG